MVYGPKSKKNELGYEFQVLSLLLNSINWTHVLQPEKAGLV